MLTFERKLANLATLALRVGVNLEAGQRLVVAGPLEAADLLREIARQAYRMGAAYVDVQYLDDEQRLIRAMHAAQDSLDFADEERPVAMKAKIERGDAILRVFGADPDLLSQADPARVATMTLAQRQVEREVSTLMQRSYVPWTIVAYAVPAWARKVFPDMAEDEAVAKLWDAIFAATRADVPDPLAAWEEHLENLSKARDHLNSRDYRALHLRAPGTDLRLGLADNHTWESGGLHSEKSGQFFVANMPTEEVFTAPHARRVDGVISSSKPLSYNGQLIDRFQLTFEDGAVVRATAETGEAALLKLLEMDDGARRLGEIALVPHQSPISQSGLLFYNTLFDENAACHVALGRAYETTFRHGTKRPLDELKADGFNESLAHVDFMFGSDELDIDGEREDGSLEPVMRGGEWAY